MAIDTSLAGLEPLVNFRQDYLQNQRQQEVLELQRQELRQRQQEQAQLLALRQAAERREQAESNQRAAVAARRFLGLRNFQADVASGINSSEALDKHKADLFFGDPDAQVNFERVKEIERHNREMEKISSQRLQPPAQRPLPGMTPTRQTIPQVGGGSITYESPDATKAAAPTSRQREIDAYLDAVDKGDTRRAELLRSGLQEKGWSITTNPDGTVTVTQGPTGTGTVPAATTTRANESLLGARAANAIGRELIPLLSPLSIGPGGMAKRVVVTKGLANLLPSLKAGTEIDVESLATAYRADVTRALRVDQMAETERKEIKAALPDEKAIFESPQAATRAIQNFNRLVATRARLAAQQAGLAVPPDLMTPTELREAVRAGRIDRATAERLALESPFADEMNR